MRTFIQMIKNQYICVFKSDSKDIVVLGLNRVRVLRFAGSQ